ncbi:MAG: quinone-dependent dihydroorotate dehydrogenase [Betaproteobacteria bacterium]
MNLYPLVRPFLFCLEAEHAHDFSLNTIDQAFRMGILPNIIGKVPALPTQFCGLHLPNPVGLAAGLDKDGKHIDALASLGFGFIEIGTVTPLAQPGNPLPRMFRLPQAQGIINRMGFNNDGVDACVVRVRASQFYQSGGVIGLNIGKNANTPIENASQDYVTCLQKVYGVASYVTINISSPNTKNLRQLQGGQDLIDLLQKITDEREKLSQQFGKRIPIFLKIAPDLDHENIDSIAQALLQFQIDALIATNTTLSRDGVENMVHANEAGGLSGKPVKHISTKTIKSFADVLQGRIPIIGVGGIMTGYDALEKHHAGASLVQLYSGLIFKGPQLIKDSIVAFEAV